MLQEKKANPAEEANGAVHPPGGRRCEGHDYQDFRYLDTSRNHISEWYVIIVFPRLMVFRRRNLII
jgi:hypothetical protein